ncbi:putative FBD-associated F-box protein [Cardamine amara subsp. amara]|uniref:FBD-associated F-box protein n=1 Tax=Cardamine amara subsp. amara TaxID=228776 RepID=A0ABD1BWZ1_CARAN
MSYLLPRLLKDSSNLQVLELSRMDNHGHYNDMDDWNKPSTVPECLLLSLQTFNWLKYTGTPEEKDIAVYILKNAAHLKTATIKYREGQVPKFEMIKELALSSRASTKCQLMFLSI